MRDVCLTLNPHSDGPMVPEIILLFPKTVV